MATSRITSALRRLLGLTVSPPIKKTPKSSWNTSRVRLAMETMEDRTVPSVTAVNDSYVVH